MNETTKKPSVILPSVDGVLKGIDYSSAARQIIAQAPEIFEGIYYFNEFAFVYFKNGKRYKFTGKMFRELVMDNFDCYKYTQKGLRQVWCVGVELFRILLCSREFRKCIPDVSTYEPNQEQNNVQN